MKMKIWHVKICGTQAVLKGEFTALKHTLENRVPKNPSPTSRTQKKEQNKSKVKEGNNKNKSRNRKKKNREKSLNERDGSFKRLIKLTNFQQE